MEPNPPRTCGYCGKPFEWTNPRQKFCNRNCKGAFAGRKWDALHPELAKVMHKKADEARRARIREMNRHYQELNGDRYRANARAEYAENRVEEAAKRRQWFWDNHGVSLEAGRRAYYKSREAIPWLVGLQSAKARCKKSGWEFALTREWAKERWTGRCEITDIPFIISKRPAPFLFSPSIDRIDPERGYVPDNCRFILFAVNAMKGSGTDEDILAIARAIVAKLS